MLQIAQKKVLKTKKNIQQKQILQIWFQINFYESRNVMAKERLDELNKVWISKMSEKNFPHKIKLWYLWAKKVAS